jgi:hypothetical protein
MKVRIILDGSSISFCSSHPLEFVRGTARDWLKKISGVGAMDRRQGNWSPDGSASFAKVSKRR